MGGQDESGVVIAALECATYGADPLVVTSFVGEEALNAPYGFTVVARLPDADADASLLFEQDVALLLRRKRGDTVLLERRVPGICVELEELGVEHDHQLVRVSLRPALAYGGLGRRTRIFQEKSAKEILEEVLSDLLGAFGRSVQVDTTRELPKRECCVQYAETDLAFVSRLMEEEGISYGFDFTGEVEVMVLRDHNRDFERIATTDGTVPFESHTTGITSAESIFELGREDRTRPTAFAARDHEWTKDGLFVETQIDGEDPLGRVREVYEHGAGRSVTHSEYDSGTRRYGACDLEERAKLRHEEHGWDVQTCSGESRAIGFSAGITFDVVSHPDGALNGCYLLCRVEHFGGEAHRRAGDRSGGAEGSYHNRFLCTPVDVPYRPRRVTPKPTIPGAQTATVTGPSGQEIHVDEHGRVRVQFDWDREGADDETSTCWVRCAEAWAGNGWGALYHPRIGMEVLVSFVHGDPDRPLVTGCLYNGVNAPPYALPAEKTKSTIKSNSTLGGHGFNELRFEDKAGSEQFYLHAQKDLNEEVLANHTTTVGGNQANNVGRDQTQTIKDNQTEKVLGTQDMKVGGNRTVTVAKNFEELVIGGEKRKVTSGGSDETIDAGEKHLELGATNETIAGAETRSITDKMQEVIVGDVCQVVVGPSSYTITSTQGVMAIGPITVKTPSAFMWTAVGATNVVGVAGGTIACPAVTLVMATTINRGNSSWFSFSPTSTSNVGTSIAMTGLNLQNGIANAGATGFKAELKQIAIGIAGAKASAAGISIETWTLKLATDASFPSAYAVDLTK